jgi:hypothetical protein
MAFTFYGQLAALNFPKYVCVDCGAPVGGDCRVCLSCAANDAERGR